MQAIFFSGVGMANLNFHSSLRYFIAESELWNNVTGFKSLL